MSRRIDNVVMFGWKKVMLNRWMMDKTSPAMKNMAIRMFFRKAWGPRRNVPVVTPASFNKQWKALKGIKD